MFERYNFLSINLIADFKSPCVRLSIYLTNLSLSGLISILISAVSSRKSEFSQDNLLIFGLDDL